MNLPLAIKLPSSVLGTAVMLAMAGAAQAQNTPAKVNLLLPSGLGGDGLCVSPRGVRARYGDGPTTSRLRISSAARCEQCRCDSFMAQGGPYHARPDGSGGKAGHISSPCTGTVYAANEGQYDRHVGKLERGDPGQGGRDFTTIYGYFAVPNVASQTAGTGNAYSSIWVGLDGNGTSDLIQDGTESDWVGGKAVYDAWVEVLPAAETVLTGLKIAAGDAIYTTTSYVVTGGKATAQFTVANFNTNKNVSTSIAFPTTLNFTGQSAEWVVERTEVNGSFENPMPRYGLAFFSAAYAQKGG